MILKVTVRIRMYVIFVLHDLHKEIVDVGKGVKG